MHRTNQIDNWFVARNKCGVNCIGRQKVSIAGAQSVSFVADAQFQFAANDPMGLIFGVRVRSVLRPGRVAPLKNAVALGLQALSEIASIRLVRFAPPFDLNAHA